MPGQIDQGPQGLDGDRQAVIQHVLAGMPEVPLDGIFVVRKGGADDAVVKIAGGEGVQGQTSLRGRGSFRDGPQPEADAQIGKGI